MKIHTFILSLTLLSTQSFAEDITLQPVTEFIESKFDYNTHLILPTPSYCLKPLKTSFNFIMSGNINVHKIQTSVDVLETYLSIKTEQSSPEQIYNIYQITLEDCLAQRKRINYDISNNSGFARMVATETMPMSNERKVEILDTVKDLSLTKNYKTCFYYHNNEMTIDSYLMAFFDE